MKTLTFFLFLMAFISTQAKKIEIPGIIVIGRDTMHVVFKVYAGVRELDYLKIQDEIKFITDKNIENTLVPTQEGIVCIFQYNSREVRMISLLNPFPNRGILTKDPYLFYKLELDGFLRVFRYDYTQTNGQYGSYLQTTFVYKRGNEPLYMPIKFSGFRKNTMAYFIDCPLLVAKIKDHSFGKEDLLQIADFYNRQCR